MKNSIVNQAEQIANDFLLEKVTCSYHIVGKGFVNQVCLVETASHKVIVRMNNPDTYPTFLKEKWCIERATSAGIPGPETLSVGVNAEHAYMIQTVVEGDNGLDMTVSPSMIWRKLGEYTQRLQSIPVTGFGRDLHDSVQDRFYSPPHAGSDGSWQGYVQYNINSLTEQDPLIELGVMTMEESQVVRQLFEQMKMQKFCFGLCHGDLSLKNTIVSLTGEITILDWGNAEVTVTPYGDIIQLLQCQLRGEGPDNEELKAFLEGYGTSVQEQEHELNQARYVLLLKAFDTLRWSIDRSPDQIEFYTTLAKQALEQVWRANSESLM
ncbi:phosphotransferase [Paenibacillus amylolyticus]|uniref:Phosphotransferase n=1 Tax=Paenibacillus amylolyticus TaxID=1451 RepID=A0A1R1BNW6_PAEAM|nr:aminoglycoside phosphotransferase family protein [Paenibacillus amylolyticus]OMF11425.1 phosphotransferase [Paenibacillus amylolyticus]